MVPCAAYCQKDYYRLDGSVVIDGGATYAYQLDFREKNGEISGYSLTWLEDTLPSKSLIEGHIDKVRHTLTFSEKEDKNMLMLSSADMCYFNGTLTYQQAGDVFLLSGKFTGLNSFSQYCGRGDITLSHTAKGDSLLGVVIRSKQPPLVLPHTTPIPIQREVQQDDLSIITSGSDKELDWSSDTCIVDLWDYGTVDGDIVSVLFNRKNVLSRYAITSVKKQLRLSLHPGINTLTIVAENEGSAPPNTARLLLTDGKKQYSFTAYNTVGKSATIVLKKGK